MVRSMLWVGVWVGGCVGWEGVEEMEGEVVLSGVGGRDGGRGWV